MLRTKYHATYLPNIYDKVKVDVAEEKRILSESWKAWLSAWVWSIWPLMGLYGVFHVLYRGRYMIRSKSGQKPGR
jgi:Delta24-sterol reductase